MNENDYEDEDFEKPRIVDRSLNMEEVRKQYEMTKKLLEDYSKFNKELEEINRKVEEYRNKLMSEIKSFQDDLENQFSLN